MSCFGQDDLRRLSETIRCIYAETNRDGLPGVIVSQVGGLLRGDIAAYNEVDHVAEELRACHNYHSQEPERHFPAFVAYEKELPLPRYAARTRAQRAFTITDFLSQRHFERTNLYNNFYRLFGVRHMVVVYLETRWGCQVAVSLMRASRDFDQRERDCLTLLVPHLRQASANAERFALAGGVPTGGMGRPSHRLHLTADLQPTETPDEVGRIFREFFGSGNGLPGVIRQWLQNAIRQDPDDLLGRSRTPLAISRPGRRLVIRWVPRNPNGITLLIETRDDSLIHSPDSLPELTPREREVLRWMCEGKRNDEIGLILSASTNTVRKHVQHILEKLGVETRTAAVRTAFEGKRI